MFSEEVKISFTSTRVSVAIEILGLISIIVKANAMNKFLIINLNFYKHYLDLKCLFLNIGQHLILLLGYLN